MDGDVHVKINPQKIAEDAKWDGLKGYLINYIQLWQIEKAFRIAKTELKIKPVFHYKQRRMEAHICLNFVAYKVYKELERHLKKKQSELSL
jgi:transposase